jgi:lysophospholipase L1-like esterase
MTRATPFNLSVLRLPVCLSLLTGLTTVGVALTVTQGASAATTSPAQAVSPVYVTGGRGKRHVFDIGDSITAFTEPRLTRTLRQYRYTIFGYPGVPMAPMLGVIQSEVANEPSQDWVVELGTNDQRIGNASWATTFGNEAAALQTQHCVIFVTINPTLGTIAAGINGAIDTAVASHANFHALDWGTIEFQNAQWLQTDGIHPSASGQVELADLERTALRQYCR